MGAYLKWCPAECLAVQESERSTELIPISVKHAGTAVATFARTWATWSNRPPIDVMQFGEQPDFASPETSEGVWSPSDAGFQSSAPLGRLQPPQTAPRRSVHNPIYPEGIPANSRW